MLKFGRAAASKLGKVRVLLFFYAIAIFVASMNSSITYGGGYIHTTAALLGVYVMHYYRKNYITWNYDLRSSFKISDGENTQYAMYFWEELPVVFPTIPILFYSSRIITGITASHQWSFLDFYKAGLFLFLAAVLLSEGHRRVKI